MLCFLAWGKWSAPLSAFCSWSRARMCQECKHNKTCFCFFQISNFRWFKRKLLMPWTKQDIEQDAQSLSLTKRLAVYIQVAMKLKLYSLDSVGFLTENRYCKWMQLQNLNNFLHCTFKLLIPCEKQIIVILQNCRPILQQLGEIVKIGQG